MKKIPVLIILLLLFANCKDKYDIPYMMPETGYLVVEGFINGDGGHTTFTVTRTTKLKDSVYYKPELNATLIVENDKGGNYPLKKVSAGKYSIPSIPIDAESRYRLRIRLVDNTEYLSDYAEVKQTPPVNITWKMANGGVQLYAGSGDKSKKNNFYMWSYEEIWEINAFYMVNAAIGTDPENGKPMVIPIYDNYEIVDTLLRCWQNNSSKEIIVHTTENLTGDTLFQPLLFIEPKSHKMDILYSTEIKQYAISPEAYSFYLQMKKNTEQLGTIFDPMPSRLKGNIKNVNNPGEVVIGCVDVWKEQKKRIFISSKDLGGWNYPYTECADEIKIELERSWDPVLQIEFYKYFLPNYKQILGNKMPTRYTGRYLLAADSICADCRKWGTNKKPSFWPN